jgi:hypothetical protein
MMDKMIYFITKFYLKGIVITFTLSALMAACSLEGNIEALRQKPGENPGLSIPAPGIEVPDPPGKPVIVSGINQLTVYWVGSNGASSYEVYINTTSSTPSVAAVTTDKTNAVINNLENDIIYYLWVRAVNSAGKSGYSSVEAGTPKTPTIAPAAPGRPILTAGNRELSVYWQAVDGAAIYEVWVGTSGDPAQAQKYGGDITGGITETIITGLTNEQTYYVWIKAKNDTSTSSFSLPANAKPSAFVALPETPDMPTVIPGNRELSVSWQPLEGTLFYEIWTGVTNNPANAVKHGADISGTSITLTGLVNGTTYYIWLRAKNNIGAGDFSAMATGIPSLFEATPLEPSSAPSVSVGDARLVLNWQAVEGAISYEIWVGTTTNQTSAEKRGNDVSSPSGTITGLSNGTTYYIWIKAKNNVGTSGFSPMASGKPIANMGAVTLVSGNRQLTASWSTVAGADQYEVYYSTNNSIPTIPAQTVSTTTATITNLTNGTTYYVWVKSKNNTGLGNASTVVNGKPLGTPGLPTISSDYKQLLISWTNVAGAEQYEVYYGTGTPSTLAATTFGTTTTITGLTDGTTYHVRLRAKNNTGVSDYGPSASGVPANERSPGLYRNNARIGNQNLSASISYIYANAVSGDDFYIILGKDESSSPRTFLFTGKTVGITLMGYGGEKKITLNSSGYLFSILTGVTFTLDENISLIGMNTNNAALVKVDDYGTFIMNHGTISGNTANAKTIEYLTAPRGGGIYIGQGTFIMNSGTISGNTATRGGGIYVNSSTGTFTMYGGSVSGNTCGIFLQNGIFTMHGGTISGNTIGDSNNSGGGVFLADGIFTMHGGTISGNTAGAVNGGGISVSSSATFKKLPSGSGQNSGIIYGTRETGVDANGVPLKNSSSSSVGHAIVSSGGRRRNTTAGQTDHIDTTTGRGLSVSGEPPYGQ